MGLIKWTDDFSVNHAKIDDQHQKWIAIFNHAHDQMMDRQVKRGFAIGQDALKEMISYTKHHFAFEETVMEDIGYPDLKEHRKIHEDFVQKLDRVALQNRQEGPVLNSEIIKLAENWFVDHILKEDQKFKTYFKSDTL